MQNLHCDAHWEKTLHFAPTMQEIMVRIRAWMTAHHAGSILEIAQAKYVEAGTSLKKKLNEAK